MHRSLQIQNTEKQHDIMIRFRMIRISTVQFAILSKDAADGYAIETSAEIKHTPDGSSVAVSMTFSFENNKEKDMILQVLCEFGIHPDDLQAMTSGNKVTIPKGALEYFLAQTVGTARGILHCKTEGTPFNGIIIPPLNVTTMLDSDMVIELREE